jgi:hypothetical protein
MGKTRQIAILCGACLFSVLGPLNGDQLLRMDVSPSVSQAPAALTVRVTVKADAENRLLQIAAESPNFYRSSETQIDGSNSTSLNVFEFRNLPAGTYQITGVLLGTRGPRATVLRLARVVPTVGSR